MTSLSARLAAALIVAAFATPMAAAATTPSPETCDDMPACAETLEREVLFQRLMPFGNGSAEIITTGTIVGGADLPWMECLTPTPTGYAVVLCLPSTLIDGAILAADAPRLSAFSQPVLRPLPIEAQPPMHGQGRHEPMGGVDGHDHHDAHRDAHHAAHHGGAHGGLGVVLGLVVGALIAAGGFLLGRRSIVVGRSKRDA